MFKSVACVLALASAALAAPVAEVSSAAPSGVEVTSVGILGSGCLPGTADYTLNSDKSSITISYSELTATAGPGIPISSNRKACQVTLGFKIPAGYSLAVSSVDHEGYQTLDRAATASHNSLYYFQAQATQETLQTQTVGPVSKAYSHTENFEGEVQSACGVSSVLNINSDVRVKFDSSKAPSNARESVDRATSRTYHFKWRKC